MHDEYKIKKNPNTDEDEETLMEESANVAKDFQEIEEFELSLEYDFYAHADTKRTNGYKQAIKNNHLRSRDIEAVSEYDRNVDFEDKEMMKEHFRQLLLKKRKESKDKSILIDTKL